MLKNHITIALRSLLKSRGYSFINIVGLAVGMACAILIFLVVRHETSYDLAQSRLDRIYRVENENLKEGHTYPGLYTGMGNALRTDLPEAEVTAPFLRITKTFAAGEKRFRESFVFADQGAFRMLDYHWLSGNPATALTQPNTVVLTRTYAQKYFGTVDALGKIMRIDNKQDISVAGVIEDYPSTTSFAFNLMVSFSTLKNLDPEFNQDRWNGWNDNFQVFVLLKKGVQPYDLNNRFEHIIEKYMGKDALEDKRFKLAPLADLHYSRNLADRQANVSLLQTLSFIGLLVLLIACFNFINLSTAQAFKRAKEVGIRKAIGSNRKLLISQFLTEAGLTTILATVLAALLSVQALPNVAAMLAIPLSNADLFNTQTALFAGNLALITTLLAGFYPALRLSGMSPVWTLKSNVVTKTNQWFSLRQGLVVVQFTVSLVLITSALMINRQLSFFRNADLGFNKAAIITVGLPDNKPEKLLTLRNLLTKSAQIKDVSFSFNSASAESNWMQGMQFRQGPKMTEVKTQMKMGDSHFLDTYGIKLLAGEPLKDSDTTDFKVLANEIFLNRIGISNPQEAVGQRIYYGDGDQFAIISGVVKNFNVNSLHQKIDPTLIQVVPNNFYQAGIKLQSGKTTAESVKTALAQIEKSWSMTYPNEVFEYSFLDDTLAQAYQSETRTASLIEVSTFLAILIACMGLFGLATFTAEQRTKEIGVRKVLGASVSSIVTLLSKDFLKLVLIAIIIASPIAWYVMSEWLKNFEFRISIEWWMFAITGLLMICTALMTVSFQSVKAALLNPVKSLRSE